MGTRVTRIRGKQLAADRLQDFVGETVEVIRRTDQTLTATLAALEGDTLILTDNNRQWYNTGYHTHRISLSDVIEVLVTQQEAY